MKHAVYNKKRQEQPASAPVARSSEATSRDGAQSGVGAAKGSVSSDAAASVSSHERSFAGRGAGRNGVRGGFPALYDLLVWFALFIVAQLVGAAAAWTLGLGPRPDGEALAPDEMGRMLAVSGGVAYVLALILMLVYRRVRGGRGRLIRLSIRGFDPLFLLWGLIFMLAVGVVLEPLLVLLPAPPAQLYGTGLWTIVAVVVMAPLFEELICRGVVLESLRGRFGVVGAWALSSLFFGAIHLQPQLSVNALFMGMILAYVVIRTGSLWSSILLHAINNSIAYVALAVGIDHVSLSELVQDPAVYGVVYAMCGLITLVSAVMAGRVLRRLHRAEREKMAAEV